MDTLTLSFRGLCAFVQRGTMVEVLLNPTGGHHKATLTALTDYLDPDSVHPASRWRPDFLGHVPMMENEQLTHKQIAVWDLTGVRVSFPGQGSVYCPSDGIVNLGHRHEGAKTLPYPAGFGAVELTAGKLSPEDEKPFDITCGAKKTTETVAAAMRCTGLPLDLLSARGIIRFRENSGAMAIVSNLSTQIDREKPFKHFDHYYDVIERDGAPIPREYRCSIDPPGGMRQRTDEVYDCVPPTGGP